MDNRQGPTVQHRELCSMLYVSLERGEVWGRTDTCIRMAESLAVHLKLSQHVNRPYLNTKQKVKMLVAQSCPTLCNPMDCSQPCSSVHTILQARIPEWVAIPFSRGIFKTQGLNLGLLYCRLIYAVLSHSVMSDSLQLRGL